MVVHKNGSHTLNSLRPTALAPGDKEIFTKIISKLFVQVIFATQCRRRCEIATNSLKALLHPRMQVNWIRFRFYDPPCIRQTTHVYIAFPGNLHSVHELGKRERKRICVTWKLFHNFNNYTERQKKLITSSERRSQKSTAWKLITLGQR